MYAYKTVTNPMALNPYVIYKQGHWMAYIHTRICNHQVCMKAMTLALGLQWCCNCFYTSFTLPVNLILTKHLTGSVHAVTVIPDVTGITHSHLILACGMNNIIFGFLATLFCSPSMGKRETWQFSDKWLDVTMIKPNHTGVQGTAYVKGIGNG